MNSFSTFNVCFLKVSELIQPTKRIFYMDPPLLSILLTSQWFQKLRHCSLSAKRQPTPPRSISGTGAPKPTKPWYVLQNEHTYWVFLFCFCNSPTGFYSRFFFQSKQLKLNIYTSLGYVRFRGETYHTNKFWHRLICYSLKKIFFIWKLLRFGLFSRKQTCLNYTQPNGFGL